MRNALFTFAIASLSTAPVSLAQDDAGSGGHGIFGIEGEPLVGPLVADRPDVTDSPITVPKGHLQIEAGFTFYDDPDLWIFPEALFRLGVTRDLEIRLTAPSYFDFDGGGDDGDGWTDLVVGAKWWFLDQSGPIPMLAVIPYLTIPTGDEPLGSDDVEFGTTLAAGWDLGQSLTLTANLGLETFERSSGSDSVATLTSVSLGFPIGEQTGGFVEYYAYYPGSFNDSQQAMDGGVTHHIHNNLMLDARIGFGLNDDAPDFLVGAGVTWRY